MVGAMYSPELYTGKIPPPEVLLAVGTTPL